MVAEIKYDNKWGETGYIYAEMGYGVRATQLIGNNYDKIILISGGCLGASPHDAGGGFENYGVGITSAPYRVIVTCLD